MLAELDRLGTIAAVARYLHQAAPGVSMQLSALERDVGVALTEKDGRSVRLTPAGRVLAQHGLDIVERLTLAEMEVRALRDGAAGTYRVAAFPSAARTIVAATWAELLTAGHSSLHIELVEMEPREASSALRAGDVDLAITHTYSTLEPIDSRHLSVWPLHVEPVWFAAPAARGLTGPIDLQRFAAEDWLVPRRDTSCYDMVVRACGAAGFSPHVTAQATDFSVLLALVSAGAGVALIPELSIDRLPGGVQLISLERPVDRHLFLAARSSSAGDPGLARLRAAIARAASMLVKQSVDHHRIE